MKIAKKLTAICLAFVLTIATSVPVSAHTPTTARVINIHNVEGNDVSIARSPGGRSTTPRSGQSVHSGNVLNTGRNSFVYLQLDVTSIAKMDQISRVAVSTVRNALSLSVQQGELLVEVEQLRPEHTLEVLIGSTVFGVRGTSFIIGHRQVGSASAVFVTMLSGEGAMQIPGMAREVPVRAGQTLLVVLEQRAMQQQYTIRGFDITDMSLFELREIYSRRDMLLNAGILTQQQVQQIPAQISHREAERAETWARQDALVGIVPTPTPLPTPIPIATQHPTPVLDGGVTTVSVGEIIQFDNYSWRVLEVRGDQALLLSEYVLFNGWYHHTVEAVSWETSGIRRYLNNDFFNRFNPQNRVRIATTTVINNDNQWFGTSGGSNTTDRIFLLSIDEVVRFFGNTGQLANRPDGAWGIVDEYDEARIARNLQGSTSWWWLRSPGSDPIHSAIVCDVGHLMLGGNASFVFGGVGRGVRPAMWIYLTP